ncbi:EamA family transporter RarD [Leptolyngbyaceae cyanobacterium CCMR0082]|uniref:EamA family transporter RarD n=2 Tax=Adonisia turfae TaxID=2950184 RepID=A0A6M0S3X3_9CYAN|nr:EamA family transporter RarD [Adonisia turfae]MDV3351024.1 EamA family transporter RarD [Leptothoe sp. LEGE 181152]NEZ58256.1 EamA family transporter RarD [Adonisia turfae CCMR0081]NEZ62763.1 EamA family transporter RarD [Adonisia turfae CCMR0082]
MNIQSGPLYAILAYGSWGLLPIYWKFFSAASPIEVLSHRMLWSLVFLSLILTLQRRLSELRKLPRRQVLGLLATALLLSVNWGLYIYGVNTDQIVETSLGYFINPLVSVMLGFVVLRERLYRGQQLAVVLATIGVGYFIWQFGSVPWIALGLAGTFALYGLLRKMVAVSPMVGLAVETALMTPVALLLIFYWQSSGTGSFGSSFSLTLLFIGAGVATSMPLLWFNNAAKRLSLATLGFCQYIAPSLQLMLGVFLYQESFTQTHLISFSCIWTALLVYSSTSLFRARSTA